jgi:hypothetical protein
MSTPVISGSVASVTPATSPSPISRIAALVVTALLYRGFGGRSLDLPRGGSFRPQAKSRRNKPAGGRAARNRRPLPTDVRPHRRGPDGAAFHFLRRIAAPALSSRALN